MPHGPGTYGSKRGRPPITKALRGILIKKGTKLAYRLATKKYPQVFKKKKFSVAEYKAKKMRKTPELASLGVTKIAANDLRKLAVAQAIKSRITHLGNLAIKHNKKAVSLIWSKAKNLKQVFKLDKYNFSQGTVVRNNKVVVIEGKSGTTRMLKKCKNRKYKNKGVLVKFPKKSKT